MGGLHLVLGLALIPLTVAELPTFTPITEGPIASTSAVGTDLMSAWGDLNNDGFEDLVIADEGISDWNSYPPRVVTRAVPQVYLNNRDGTFRRATEADIGPLATSATAGGVVALADYDNDGYLDFYQNAWLETHLLWRGGPDGRFTLVPENVGPNIKFEGQGTGGYAWADYDRDGFLDLYVTTGWAAYHGLPATLDYLYRNRGDGTFERLSSPLAIPNVDTIYSFWADYDNDGDPDLPLSTLGGGSSYFFRNDGSGRFTSLNTFADLGERQAWGDYDNDGDLDVWVHGASLMGLRENDGAGAFVPRQGDGYPTGSAGYWADIDNDGWLELVARSAKTHRLFRYHPETKRWTEEPWALTNIPYQTGTYGAWSDYDNDGFMDLVIAGRPNWHLRNNGNGNHWLHVKPIGTRSNRSAVGARITVEAEIFGQALSQIREMSAMNFGQSLRAHFGLGDATEISRLIIRWPNGAREELTGIAPNQILTVVEPSVHATRQADGSIQLEVWGNAGRSYSVQTSSDFETWTTLETVTGKGTEGPVEITDPATDGPRRFYRMTVP